MRSLSSILAGLRTRIGAVLGLAVVLSVPIFLLVAGTGPKPATADHYKMCSGNNPEAQTKAERLTATIKEVTGETPVGNACNPAYYNGGNWGAQTSDATLKTYVTDTMTRCGTTLSNKKLTQAVIEVTGQVPVGSVCATSLYTVQSYTYFGDTGSYNGQYSGPNDGPEDVAHPNSLKGRVTRVMEGACNSEPLITQAIIQETGGFPNRTETGTDPDPNGNIFTTAPGSRGQCNPRIYNNGNWFSYDYDNPNDPRDRSLLGAVHERKVSPGCSTSTTSGQQINQASVELTGWKPLPWECETWRYGFSWPSYIELKTRLKASYRCWDPWINQAYVKTYNREARGRRNSAECNRYLYEIPTQRNPTTYASFNAKVRQTQDNLAAQKLVFRPSGSGLENTATGAITDIDKVRIQASNVIASGGLNVIASGGGNVIATGGLNLIGHAGGTVIQLGGGTLIAPNGGASQLIGDAGSELIGQAGGTLR